MFLQVHIIAPSIIIYSANKNLPEFRGLKAAPYPGQEKVRPLIVQPRRPDSQPDLIPSRIKVIEASADLSYALDYKSYGLNSIQYETEDFYSSRPKSMYSKVDNESGPNTFNKREDNSDICTEMLPKKFVSRWQEIIKVKGKGKSHATDRRRKEDDTMVTPLAQEPWILKNHTLDGLTIVDIE